MINCNLLCDSCTRQILMASKSREKLEKLQQIFVPCSNLGMEGVRTTPLLLLRNVTALSFVTLDTEVHPALAARRAASVSLSPAGLEIVAGKNFSLPKAKAHVSMLADILLDSRMLCCLGITVCCINNKVEVPHVRLFQCCCQTYLGHLTGPL